VSRLARNNADWHRLLQICAMSATLICDEDGLYDPTDFNDRAWPVTRALTDIFVLSDFSAYRGLPRHQGV
jgi:DNA invertase Pin-like site-specific DNA recombinase